MYQWSNPASGIVQLSGTPPAWYRSPGNSPRVLVFDNGQLVDDTAVAVAEDLRQSLRADAFGAVDEIVSAPVEVPQSDDTLRNALETAARDGVDVSAVTEAFAVERERDSEASGGSVEETVAELKSLLDAWDSRRLDEAKALLRDAAPQAGPAAGR